jgi:hypothetical protein
MCLRGYIYSLTDTSRLNPLWIGALVLVIRISFLSNLGTVQVVKVSIASNRTHHHQGIKLPPAYLPSALDNTKAENNGARKKVIVALCSGHVSYNLRKRAYTLPDQGIDKSK